MSLPGEHAPRHRFAFIFDEIPADDPFWTVPPGDPGVEGLFGDATYVRGGLTLQALRFAVGDAAFWAILDAWVEEHAFGTGTTSQFIALAERVSGEDLDALFQAWLFTPQKPSLTAASTVSLDVSPRAARAAGAWLEQLEGRIGSR